MAYLIVLLIAIALTAYMTGNSMFLGGDAYTNGSSDAIASSYVNQAQQIQNSSTLFRVQNGSAPADIQALVDGDYLQGDVTTPDGGSWTIDGSVIYTDPTVANDIEGNITPEVCDKINENGADIVLCGVVATADEAGINAALFDSGAPDPVSPSVGDTVAVAIAR